jgi:excisionase family DNA binding protein
VTEAGAPDWDRLLTLAELCAWLNITERHARKLIERDAIPYRKVGHLLRFSARDVDTWSRPTRKQPESHGIGVGRRPEVRRSTAIRTHRLPKSILD